MTATPIVAPPGRRTKVTPISSAAAATTITHRWALAAATAITVNPTVRKQNSNAGPILPTPLIMPEEHG